MSLLRWTLFAAIFTACAGPSGGGKDTDTTPGADTDVVVDDTDAATDTDVPLPGAPAAPSDVLAQATSTTSLHVAWTDNSDDEDEFRVELKSGGGAFAALDPVTEATLDLTGRTPGEAIELRVRACKAGDLCSPYSATAALTLPVGAVPAAPDGLTAITLSTSSLGIDWTDHATNETAYVIAYSTDGGFTFTDYPEVPAGTQSADDGGLEANSEYCYQVRARGVNGDSPPSNTACATTLAVTAPRAPTAVTAALASDTEILLTWTNPDANDGYKIFESVGGGAYNFAGTVTPGNQAGAFIDGLTAGATYSYKVVAYSDARGDSAQSAASNAVTLPAAPAPTATVFVNASAYPIISLEIDGVEQFPAAPRGLPPGGSLTLALAPGAHTYAAANGFWSGALRETLYTYSGSQTQASGQTGTVTLRDPSLPQLLTQFGTSGSYTGEYWSGTQLNYKTLRFFSNGTYNYYNNGALVGTGTATLVSYPGSYLVTFNISGVQSAQGVLDERYGTFFMRNGPADWPTLQYVYDGP
jgi:hypothetical protein